MLGTKKCDEVFKFSVLEGKTSRGERTKKTVKVPCCCSIRKGVKNKHLLFAAMTVRGKGRPLSETVGVKLSVIFKLL